ncbi:MAG: hypothetical protein JRN52_00770 [Nitrososphaerota archaeon]|nr:hypothetical protein [Nitrososphaerota archaeon]
MRRDRSIGILFVTIAVLLGISYVTFMFFLDDETALFTIKITMLLGILVLAGILGWMGYVMITAPSHVSLQKETISAAKTPASSKVPTDPEPMKKNRS